MNNKKLFPSQREVLKFIALTSLFCFYSHAQAEESPASKDHYFYICKNQKTVRTLRMDKKSVNCEAVYTKDGVDKVIGGAQKLSSCVDVLEGVKKTLTDAGWKCKEIKGEHISSRTDVSSDAKSESKTESKAKSKTEFIKNKE